MPIDSSIYSLIQPQRQPDLMQMAGGAMQLKQLMSQQGLQDLQRAEMERGIAEEGQLRDLFRQGKPTAEQVFAVSPKRGMEFQKAALEGQKSEAAIAKDRAATLLQNATYLRDRAAQIRPGDQAGWNLYRDETVKLFGPEAAKNLPDVATPEVLTSLMQKADDLIVPLAKRLELESSARGQDMTSASAAAGRATTERGQDMASRTAEAGRNQPIWDSDRGVFVNRPQMGAPGTNMITGARPGAVPAAPATGGAPSVIQVPGLPAKADQFGEPKEVTGPDGKPRLVMQNKRTGALVDANTKEPVQGVGPKPGETAQKQLTGVQATKDAIGEYRKALKSWGVTDIVNPNARARMGTVYNNMLLQAKEAFNLGVLNGPDYKILQEVITSPASLKGGITSNDALDAQAAKLDEILTRVGAAVTETQSGVPSKGSLKSFADLPDPAQFNGKVARNPQTGERYKSNGKNWVRM